MLTELAIGLSVGTGFVGLLVGRLLKKERIKEVIVEVPGEPLPAKPFLKFFSLIDYVDVKPLLEQAEKDQTIFINIEKLNLDPFKRGKFLSDLDEESHLHNVELRTINPDLIMIVSKDARIEIRAISPQNFPLAQELSQ